MNITSPSVSTGLSAAAKTAIDVHASIVALVLFAAFLLFLRPGIAGRSTVRNGVSEHEQPYSSGSHISAGRNGKAPFYTRLPQLGDSAREVSMLGNTGSGVTDKMTL